MYIVATILTLSGVKIPDLDLSDPTPHIALVVFELTLITWLLLYLPYKRHKAEEKKHKDEMEAEKQKIEDEYKHLFATQVIQIKELKGKLEEKSETDQIVLKREMAKEHLGYRLIALQDRLHEARQISRISFNSEIRDKAWETTSEVFNETEKIIIEWLGIAEAALFRVAAIAPAGNINGYSAESIMDWQWHVNSIMAKQEALQEIIKKLT